MIAIWRAVVSCDARIVRPLHVCLPCQQAARHAQSRGVSVASKNLFQGHASKPPLRNNNTKGYLPASMGNS